MTGSQRYGATLYAGRYIDKPGAVVLVGDQIAHLTAQQCLQLAQKLTACAQGDTAAAEPPRSPS